MILSVSNGDRVVVGFFFGQSGAWAAPDLATLELMTDVYVAFGLGELGIVGTSWPPPADFDFAATRDVEITDDSAAILYRSLPPFAVPAVIGPHKVRLLRKLRDALPVEPKVATP